MVILKLCVDIIHLCFGIRQLCVDIKRLSVHFIQLYVSIMQIRHVNIYNPSWLFKLSFSILVAAKRVASSFYVVLRADLRYSAVRPWSVTRDTYPSPNPSTGHCHLPATVKH